MRSKRRALCGWVIGLAVLAVSAGCSAAPSGPRGTDTSPGAPSTPAVERVVHIPGPIGERTAAVFHPASAGAGAPLVVVLHPADGSGANFRTTIELDKIARREGFVVAYPDALDGRWNAGLCCRDSAMLAVDDVEFLHQLRQQLVADDRVDPSRVYAMGMSNGGMLSYAWACDRPGDVAAIGVVAATLTTGCTELAPLTVVAVHGTSDNVVPLKGGVTTGNRRIPSLDDALAPFLAAAACPPDPVTDRLGPATVATWRCAQGRSVVRTVIDGVKHTWPGVGGRGGDAGENPRDATDFIWHRMSVAAS